MSKAKPGTYPVWLYNAKDCSNGGRLHLWICSGCNGPAWMPEKTGLFRAVGPCWRSVSYGVKCVTPSQVRCVYPADAAYTTEQPKQEVEPTDKWDHATQCISHFRHPAYRKRLCVLPGQTEEEVRADADLLAG